MLTDSEAGFLADWADGRAVSSVTFNFSSCISAWRSFTSTSAGIETVLTCTDLAGLNLRREVYTPLQPVSHLTAAKM